jgi:hypothetical protein
MPSHCSVAKLRVCGSSVWVVHASLQIGDASTQRCDVRRLVSCDVARLMRIPQDIKETAWRVAALQLRRVLYRARIGVDRPLPEGPIDASEEQLPARNAVDEATCAEDRAGVLRSLRVAVVYACTAVYAGAS